MVVVTINVLVEVTGVRTVVVLVETVEDEPQNRLIVE